MTAVHHLYACINLGECLFLCTVQLASVVAIVACCAIFQELRSIFVRVQDRCVGSPASIIPLNFHVGIAISIGSLVEFLDESYPFRCTSASSLLIDKPSIETHVLGNLVEFLGIDIYAVLLCQHLANPSLGATICCWREEYLTE